MENFMKQGVLNVGTLGHIDHGKTTLVKAITHKWTDVHSESLKRNMTIKLGYADAIIRKCEQCQGSEAYTTSDKCGSCGGEAKPVLRISVLDAPGHETLMATAIAVANMINAILFVIAANEPCPMQQTKEHLMIINTLGIKDAIIVQTKVDLVSKEAAMKHYKQIKDFIKGSVIEDAPIVPVVSSHDINIDIILEMIVKMASQRNADTSSEPLMYIARSFDINKPGKEIGDISGGVIGGTLVRGVFKVGDEIEIRPGISKSQDSKREQYEPAITVIKGISSGEEKLEEALPGGLIGVLTELDPAFTKADSMVGNVAGHVGKLPPTSSTLNIKFHKLSRDDLPERAITVNEPLILSIATATVVGNVTRIKKDSIEVALRRPVCAEKGTKVAVMRNFMQRWKLSGYGVME
ncbi:MAG: translation initiation factor IF-2 subunit gamma [Candidatus Micrarchaeia archaeon]